MNAEQRSEERLWTRTRLHDVSSRVCTLSVLRNGYPRPVVAVTSLGAGYTLRMLFRARPISRSSPRSSATTAASCTTGPSTVASTLETTAASPDRPRSGLGAAIAHALSTAGADLVVVGRDARKLDAVAATGPSTAALNDACAERRAGGTRMPNMRIGSVATGGAASLFSSAGWLASCTPASAVSASAPTARSCFSVSAVFPSRASERGVWVSCSAAERVRGCVETAS